MMNLDKTILLGKRRNLNVRFIMNSELPKPNILSMSGSSKLEYFLKLRKSLHLVIKSYIFIGEVKEKGCMLVILETIQNNSSVMPVRSIYHFKNMKDKGRPLQLIFDKPAEC